MPKLIINADDFGLSPGVNAGILYLFQNGYISSTSLLANTPYYDDVVSICTNYSIKAGIHLVVTQGKPVTDAKNLVDENGEFFKERIYSLGILSPERIQEIEKEWDAQIQKAIDSNIQVTHLDVHHSMYLKYQSLHEVIFRLARKYHLPIRVDHRRLKNVPDDIVCADYYVRDFDYAIEVYREQPEKLTAYLENMFANIAEHEVSEMMTHPAFVDHILCQESSMNMTRMDTLNVITSKQFQDLIKKYNIEVINYTNL